VAIRSLLAKDWSIDVDTTGAGTWVPFKGMKSFTETISEAEQDDSDVDSGGYGSDVVTQRKVVLAITSARKQVLGGSFTDDPGQAFVRAQGRLVGPSSSFNVRYYRKDGAPDAYTGEVHATGVGGGGGSVTDLEAFSPTLKFHGQPTPITNPLSVAAVPIISSIIKTATGAATFLAAGGDLFRITGSNFTTATIVTMAGNVVPTTDWFKEDDNHIIGKAPAHAAGGGLPIVVTNPTGPSTGAPGATAVTYV
jgi:hypothetical protein